MTLKRLGEALEAEFFGRLDQVRIAERHRADGRRDDLAVASGLTDQVLLDRLLADGVDADVITAFALVPYVWTAWASGSVDPAQHAAVVAASHDVGVVMGSTADLLLRGWLEHRPREELYTAWKAYAHGLREIMGEPEWRAMGATIGMRARKVAIAAGGILGLFTISRAEARVLDELDALFAQ